MTEKHPFTNLSDRITTSGLIDESCPIIFPEDAKQFIKLNNSLVRGLIKKKLTVSEYWEKHDKLIGEKLK